MNYDHAYHAGNFADVLKHAALCLCLGDLLKKEKPFFVLDTHGGQGRYDLAGPQAGRTGEADAGIKRLLNDPGVGDLAPALTPYLETIQALGKALDGAPGEKEGEVRTYPGSPLIARHLMRACDRLVVAEKHPVHVQALRSVLRGAPNTRVEAGDGYALMKALLPPAERRGLVLIDPPFEDRSEFETLARFLRQALKRWASGRYLVWFPLKDAVAVDTFVRDVFSSTGASGLVGRLRVKPASSDTGLGEAGLLALNPSFSLAQGLADLLACLATVLGEGGAGTSSVERFGPV